MGSSFGIAKDPAKALVNPEVLSKFLAGKNSAIAIFPHLSHQKCQNVGPYPVRGKYSFFTRYNSV